MCCHGDIVIVQIARNSLRAKFRASYQVSEFHIFSVGGFGTLKEITLG